MNEFLKRNATATIRRVNRKHIESIHISYEYKLNGALVLSAIFKGQYIHKAYFGYTKAQATRIFKQTLISNF